MFHVVQRRTMPYPSDTVWRHLIDFPNIPTWEDGVLEVRQTSPGPPGLGTEFVARRRYAGRETHVVCRIVDWQEGRSATLALDGGPLRSASACYAVEARGADACEVTYTGSGDLVGPVRLLTPLIGSMGRRQIAANLAHLERLIAADSDRDGVA